MRRWSALVQHKPYGFLSPSTAPKGNKKFAIDLLTSKNAERGCNPTHAPVNTPGLECVGRLDADTTGLMMWTTDHTLARRVRSPKSKIEKEYLVRVDGHADWSESQREDALKWLRHGMPLDGEALLPADVTWINADQLRLTIVEGKHRQIRQMIDRIGAHVKALK